MSSPSTQTNSLLLDRYQIEARATAIYPDRGQNPVYPLLGLVEELGEVGEALMDAAPGRRERQTKELGDALWYCAALAGEAREPLGGLYAARWHEDLPYQGSPGYSLDAARRDAARLAGVVKRVCRDDRGVLTAARRRDLVLHLAGVVCAVVSVAESLGIALPVVLGTNLTKLQGRRDRGTLHGQGDDR